jgi:hypothetical protein
MHTPAKRFTNETKSFFEHLYIFKQQLSALTDGRRTKLQGEHNAARELHNPDLQECEFNINLNSS